MSDGNTHIWHVSAGRAARYADGTLPEPDTWSVEKHLEGCAGCASRVSAAVRGTAAGPVLAQVRDAVLARATPVPVPAVSRLARLLWAAGPAVRGAWPPAVLAVAVGALALSHGAGLPGARALLLAVAPVLPVAGVALSYGPAADPLYEVTAATPGGGLRLALVRTVAVLAVSLPLLTLAGLLLPASGAPAAVAWLLPGLALTLGTLALASFTGCRTAAGLTGGGWLCAVLAPVSAAPGGPLTARLAEQLGRCLDGTGTQGAWAAAAVLSAALLAARRPAYDRPFGR
ncbi:zf-HC2 domain-containing protein [Streptomyces sp. LP11]|uniref:Zf-HC2 domain-containing protein n=1 Tax=Streptomyces pyxinicus TaxID=2970331 RepID=A0ABT2BAG1_9ACTN|nr:zf-HC2 domain-containing protein [Streptomyces sp. LP11]MCS0604923.1 zf-HC2 domain-containing protein [Streptomyces sp. LP11]